MNTRTVSLFTLGAMALLGVGARAGAADDPIAPAPTAAAQPAQPALAETPRPDRIVYSGQLPSVAQLTQTAQAQGLAVASISQTATEVSVTYRLQDNSTRTVSYQLLPANGEAPAVVVTSAPVVTPAPVQVIEVPEPAPTVVYRYYDRYYDPFYYDPFYWGPRAPVSVHLGFGFGGGYRYGGGYHHHRHW